MLDALQDLPISIAVTTGPGTDPSILGPRPANVAAAPFVPQALVMPLASAVVSHTGSGTMLGALASGLPQVCLPRGADQFANADRVQSVGAGIRLLPDEVTPESLRAAVTAVLDDPAYARAAAAMQTGDRRHAVGRRRARRPRRPRALRTTDRLTVGLVP